MPPEPVNKHIYLCILASSLFHADFVRGADVTGAIESGGVSKPTDPDELYQEGSALLAGRGIPTDYVKARVCFEAAVKLGSPRAKGALGFMLLQGLGVPKDEVAALALIRDAAEAGVTSAQVNLASMLSKGQGTPRDVQAALSWYESAAVQDSMDARLRLVNFYYFGCDGVAKDYQKALPHVKTAATAGNPLAQNLLGTMFEFGLGVDVSRTDAIHWYREAAVQGDAKAQGNLGRMIRLGDPEERDLTAVYQWLKLSADQGEATATVMLADIESSLTAAQKSEAEDRIRKFLESHPRKKVLDITNEAR